MSNSPSRRRIWGAASGAALIFLAATFYLFFKVNDLGIPLQIGAWAGLFLALVSLMASFTDLKTGVRAGGSAAAFVFMAVYGGGIFLRPDLVLTGRGETVDAVVQDERIVHPENSRTANLYYYTFELSDGSRVPGPEMETQKNKLHAGEEVTLVADPKGSVAPKLKGSVHLWASLSFFAAIVLFGLSIILSPAVVITRRLSGHADKMRQQERRGMQMEFLREELQEKLESNAFDRRGYIRIAPSRFKHLDYEHAASIAGELGLKAETVGNRGAWRFGKSVISEVTPQET